MHWFTRVPLGLLNAYMKQLPRLQAEESILAATRIAVGSGKTDQGSAMVRQWNAVITPETERSVEERRERFKQSIGRLTGMGYGLRKVPAGV